MTPIPLGILDFPTGAAGAYDLLETQIVTGSPSAITFTGLDTLAADYQHLQVRWVWRVGGTSTNGADVLFTINGSGSSVYAQHTLNGDGSSVNAANLTSRTNIRLEDAATQGGSATGNFASGVMDILDFSSTNKYKTIRSLHGCLADTETDIHLESGLFQDTSAITEIEFAEASNFAVGSRVSIYGIRGA